MRNCSNTKMSLVWFLFTASNKVLCGSVFYYSNHVTTKDVQMLNNKRLLLFIICFIESSIRNPTKFSIVIFMMPHSWTRDVLWPITIAFRVKQESGCTASTVRIAPMTLNELGAISGV